MNKTFKTISISLIALFGIGFLLIPSTSAQAQDLGVVFENDPNPLFDEANFLPGESVTRYVDVTNNSGETKKIGLDIINQYPCSVDCLSDVLDLVISENGNTLYLGSLTSFYGAGEKVLSDLNAGGTTRYYFSMTFHPVAGNVYQNSTANFDIKIGFFGEESIGPEMPPGGGGAVIIAGLQIFDEAASGIGQNSVTITWRTNFNSTSRVIYSPYGFPHILNPNDPPNYGYVFSTIEDSAKVTSHTVVITGLLPATTYYFRCISHTSPDETITTEHTFTTKGVAGEETYEGEEEEDEEIPSEGPGEWIEPGEEDIPEEEVGPIVEGITAEEKEEPIVILAPEVISGFFPNLLADIGDIFGGLGSTCYSCFPWWIILILAVYPLMESALSQRREKRRAKKWLIWSLGLIVLAIIFYLTNYHCVAVWIYLVLALSTLLFWRLINPQGTKYPFIAGLLIILILSIIWLILGCLYIWIIAIAVLIYLFVVDFLKRREKRE